MGKRKFLADSDDDDSTIVSKSLHDIPTEVLIIIASYLDAESFVNFSHTSGFIYHILDDHSNSWKSLLRNSELHMYPEIRVAAENLVQNGSAFTPNIEKLTFFMHKKTKRNWEVGDFVNKPILYPGVVSHSSDATGYALLCKSKRRGGLFAVYQAKIGSFVEYPMVDSIGYNLVSFKIHGPKLVLHCVEPTSETDVLRHWFKVVICSGRKLELLSTISKDIRQGEKISYETFQDHLLLFSIKRSRSVETGCLIESFDLTTGEKSFDHKTEESLTRIWCIEKNDSWLLMVTDCGESEGSDEFFMKFQNQNLYGLSLTQNSCFRLTGHPQIEIFSSLRFFSVIDYLALGFSAWKGTILSWDMRSGEFFRNISISHHSITRYNCDYRILHFRDDEIFLIIQNHALSFRRKRNDEYQITPKFYSLRPDMPTGGSTYKFDRFIFITTPLLRTRGRSRNAYLEIYSEESGRQWATTITSHRLPVSSRDVKGSSAILKSAAFMVVANQVFDFLQIGLYQR